MPCLIYPGPSFYPHSTPILWSFHHHSTLIPPPFHSYSMPIPSSFQRYSIVILYLFHPNSISVPWSFHKSFHLESIDCILQRFIYCFDIPHTSHPKPLMSFFLLKRPSQFDDKYGKIGRLRSCSHVISRAYTNVHNA